MRFSSLFASAPTRSLTNSGAIILAASFLTVPALAQVTSEAGEEQLSDPTQECTYYNYPPVTAANSSFPELWQPATLVASDTEGQAMWAKIQPSVPTNILPKGTLTGDFSNFTPSYNPDDPDCWWSYSKCVTPKLASLKPDISSVPEPRTLGYGFDDGPNCSHNAFYDYLTEQKQTATMFYIGSNVMNWPLQAQRAITDGHEVCVHTWSHHYMTSYQSEDAFAELWYTLKAIKLVMGVTPTCWRPPYGDVDDRIRAIATGLGLKTILWEYDSNDWQVGSPGTTVTPAQVDANYQSLIQNVQNGIFDNNGAIMLTHELTNYTMSEAIKFYPQLKAAFKAIVPVGVAMNVTQPYLETNYTQPSFAQYTSGQVTTNSSSNSTTSGSGAQGGSSVTGASGRAGDNLSGAAVAVVALLVAAFAAV